MGVDRRMDVYLNVCFIVGVCFSFNVDLLMIWMFVFDYVEINSV